MTNSIHDSKIEKSVDFFKDSKVDSCSYIVIKHGQAVAVPYITAANKRVPEGFPATKRSVSHDVHRIRNHLYAGMRNKPLERYDPDAHRSRLRTEDFQIPYKNSSQVVIGNRSSNYKKHFVTTAQNLLKAPKPNFTTNMGILSAKAKWSRQKAWS